MMKYLEFLEKSEFSSIDDLLDNFHKYAANSDLVNYIKCFALNSRFLGTDSSENWTIADFITFAAPFFERKQGWNYIPRSSSRVISIFEENNVASFDELLDSPSFKVKCRGSGMLIQKQGFWYICSYHLTFPVPNEIASSVCKNIQVFEESNKLKLIQRERDENASKFLAELDLEESEKSKAPSKTKSKKK